MADRQPAIIPFGESALLCEFPPPASLNAQNRIWSAAAQARRWQHVTEVVPGVNNLTVLFDPLAADVDALVARLAGLFETQPRARGAGSTPVKIIVSYGGEDGPDLEQVAAHTGLSTDDVIARHCAAEYTVFCIGFMPGFAYLGGLPDELHTPRRETPRQSVPAGSVGIGGAQTGVYPLNAPGGWQLIGRTTQVLFDAQREPPSLLRSGDRVRFVDARNDARS